MKEYEYWSILSAIWLAPIPAGDWYPNLIIGIVCVGCMWFTSRKRNDDGTA